jgi:hypothetical protein
MPLKFPSEPLPPHEPQYDELPDDFVDEDEDDYVDRCEECGARDDEAHHSDCTYVGGSGF